MHIISKSALPPFWNKYPSSRAALEAWYKLIKHGRYPDYVKLKQTFGSADYLTPYTVFDISGNNVRIISVIHYDRQKLYIRYVLTHPEYDHWSSLYRSGKS